MWEALWNYVRTQRKGILNNKYITENQVSLHYEMPLNEVIYDFDALKSKPEATVHWTMNSSAIKIKPSKTRHFVKQRIS